MMSLSAPIFQLKRRAKMLARGANIPLHEALDRIARGEGFASWSRLASRAAASGPASALLGKLDHGDMLLVGARPGQGKTRLGLQLLRAAADQGRRALFFTLEYTEQQVTTLIGTTGGRAAGRQLEIVTSDDISADFVVQRLSGTPRGTVAVIDYLQILDQRRTKLPLSDQMRVFHAFARETGAILGFISQIDRSFDAERDRLPGIHDVRLPNPAPLGLFTKAYFLHAGEAQLQQVA